MLQIQGVCNTQTVNWDVWELLSHRSEVACGDGDIISCTDRQRGCLLSQLQQLLEQLITATTDRGESRTRLTGNTTHNSDFIAHFGNS